MKKFIFLAAAVLCLSPAARAGEIIEGSVPGTINYQGRLERDNAPITGPVHLHFRLFNSATANNTAGAPCGSPTQPCVWESAELTVQAAQGIFSAELTPGIGIFTTGQKLYLEVQVESDTLSPREALNSITYALVAKKLEDGASVIVTTLTAGYQVLLATSTDASVGIGGTIRPATKLTVDGDIELINGGVIRYPDGSSQPSALIGGVVGGITSSADATIVANTDSIGSDNILFGIPNVVGAGEKARITNNGDFGIGTPVPQGKLDVNGSLYVGNEGVYDRVDSEVNVKEDLAVEGGRITGSNLESIYLGDTDNIIAFNSNGGERARIHSNDYLGVGIAAPTAMIHSGADIAAENGARGGRVSIGDYSTWTDLLNEVRAENGYHLLLQQTSPYNVGVGTNTPREKLHVRGSVRSDYGIMAATASFSGDVRVNGEFRADGANREVFLTSTTIYGDSKIYGNLLITGGIGSVAGMPAYIASTQTFSGANTFLAQVAVSSDLASANRLGAGVADFDFAGSKYLQVGDNKPEFANTNSLTYLVAGSSAEARINFYRGAVETARLETVSANNLPNLGLVLGGQARTLTDSVYHRIQNSVLWVSTGYAGTPTIFASSSSAIVGIGTIVTDPNWRLTVAGNMRISGSGNGIFFPDGTSLTSGNLGALSVGNVSNNSDAVIQSDADQVSGGDVILRAGAVDGLVLKSGGNIGVGTVNPVSKLNVRGGDLVLGTPVNPYSGDSVEDLVVGGNIVFDGELLQRSVSQVKLSNLLVAGDVYLSTGATRRTRIGSDLSPNYTLDVAGDINASGSILTGNTARISNAGVVGSGGSDATWDGVAINVNRGGTGAGTFTSGGILYGSGTSAIAATLALGNGELLIGDGSGAPTLATLTPTVNQINITNAAGSITISLPQNIHTGASPAFAGLTVGALTGVIKGASGVLSAMNGTASYNTYWSDANTLAAEQYTALARGGSNADLSAAAQGGLIYKAASALAATGALTGVLKTNGSGVPSAMTGTAGTLAKWSDANTIAASTVSDNGADVGVGVAPTTGIKLDVNGKLRTTTFQMTSGGASNFVLTSDAGGNASWVDPAGGGLGDGWVGNEITNAANTTLTRSGLGTSGNPYLIAVNLGNSNTWTAAQTFSGGLTGTLTGSITGNAATVTTNANLTGVVTSVGNATAIANGAISNAMLANGAVANLSGTNTGDETAAGIRTKIGAASAVNNGYLDSGDWTTFNGKQAAGSYITALTGEVTASGPGSVAATIANSAVTLAKMANMATSSLIYRRTGGAGAPEVNTLATLKTDLLLTGTNSGDNAANTTYASDYRAANFLPGTDYLAPGTGFAGRVICWKTATTLSYCTTAPIADGSCTCN